MKGFDVVIIGKGMGGVSTALSLKKLNPGYRILLLHKESAETLLSSACWKVTSEALPAFSSEVLPLFENKISLQLYDKKKRFPHTNGNWISTHILQSETSLNFLDYHKGLVVSSSFWGELGLYWSQLLQHHSRTWHSDLSLEVLNCDLFLIQKGCRDSHLFFHQLRNQKNLYEAFVEHLNQYCKSDSSEFLILPPTEVTGEVFSRLQQDISLPIFEAISHSPSLSAMNLSRALDQLLEQNNVEVKRANRISGEYSQGVSLISDEQVVSTECVILSTGHLIAGGIEFEFDEIRESVFDLPVMANLDNKFQAVKGRGDLSYDESFTERVMGAHMRVNDSFHPINSVNEVISNKLFALGRITQSKSLGLGSVAVEGVKVAKKVHAFLR